MTMSATLHINADAKPASANRIQGNGVAFTCLTVPAESDPYPEVTLIYPAETPHELIAAVAAAHNAALAASRTLTKEDAA